nr:hypothetical protein [Aeromonas caviae]
MPSLVGSEMCIRDSPFHQAHPDLSQQVWDEIEEVRHSAAYARFVTGMASPGTP